MIDSLLKSAEDKMNKSLEFLGEELGTIRSARANATMLDGVKVESYGQMMQIKQLASINVPDARTIMISPWDKSTTAAIEKAIAEDESLGLTPNNDGTHIRLNIPALTEERRQSLTKVAAEKLEAAKVSMRAIRHEVLGEGRKKQTAKELTEDDVFVLEQKLNKLIDEKNKQAETAYDQKCAQLMEV